MLRLLLLRHAKTTPGGSARSDFDRHLIPRGRRAAANVGEYLAEQKLLPDLVLCSSARRARETLAAMLSFLGNDMTIHVDGELYDSSVNAYLSAIRAEGGEARTLLLIGHNPTMEECAADLLARGKSGAPPIRFPTSALAMIDFDIPDWDALRPGTGRLAGFVEPRELALGMANSGTAAP